MDQFITIKKHKNYNIFGRDEITLEILEKIFNKEVFCLYGDSGIGKTYLIKNILKNLSYNEISHDILRSKNETLNFLNNIKYTYSHLLIDDLDTEYYGWKEFAEKISTLKKISNASLIIISKSNEKINCCECIKLEPLSFNHIIELGRQTYPKRELEEIKYNAKKSKGNLRNFLHYFEFPDEKDVFFTPKETVHNLLSPSEINPGDYIGKTVEDHGYSWCIVHENYPRSSTITLEDATKISDHMSMADIYDNMLYEGDWDLCKFFCHHGIIWPSIILKQSLIRESLNPGSSWTKYNNYKMRMGKLKELKNRSKLKIDIDTLLHIRDKINHEKIGVVPFLVANNFRSQDIDLINHLGLINKIKPKLLNNIKKELKKHGEK